MINNPKKRIFLIFFLFLIHFGLKAQITSSVYTFNQGESTSGLVRSSTGDFYFISQGQTIKKVSANGVLSTFAYVSGSPTTLAIDQSNKLYFINNTTRKILTISTLGVQSTYASLSASSSNTAGSLRCDLSGNLYFLDRNVQTGSVSIIKCSTNLVRSTLYQDYSIGNLAVDKNKNIYFSQYGYYIYKLIVGSTYPYQYVSGNYYPSNMGFDGTGNLYFVDYSASTTRIMKVLPNGDVQEYVTNNSNLTTVNGLWVDPTGVLYYVDKNQSTGVQQLIKVDLPCTKPSTPIVSDQSFEDAATVADLMATGNTIKWYSAATGGDALISSTALTSRTYYVTQTVNDCESNRVPVLVTINKMGLSKNGQITANRSLQITKAGAINANSYVNKYGKSNQITVVYGSLKYEIFTAPASNPNSSTEFSSYVNPSNLASSGFNSGSLLLNWETYSTLTNAGIAIPNGGDQFAVQVSGYFVPQESGIYTFTCEGDDAVDLFINDVNVANHYGNHGIEGLGSHTGTIELVAGTSYTFRARMQENGGGEGLRVFWRKPSESSGWNLYTNELSSSN